MPETQATPTPSDTGAPSAAGFGAGLRSCEEETAPVELSVEGRVPEWLAGSLLRTGPAKWEVGENKMNHWFDGLAMLHRFEIADEGVSYASRFVQSKAYREAEATGKISYSEFGTDPCLTLFAKVRSMFSPRISDNPNINVTRLGDRFVSMTETPMPVQFDARTLESAGLAWKVPGLLTTAHPHLDRESGGIINYAAKLGPRNKYRFFRVLPGSEKAEVLAEQGVKEPAYMHSFGLTERWLVLVEFPFVVNPVKLAFGGRPYIENYRWEPELGTRVTLFDRETGEARGPFETDPFFAFHHINAYEEGDEVVVDLAAFDDPGLIEDLYLERLRAGSGIPVPEIRRLRVDLASEKVSSETLLEDGLDLPRINYGRCNERPYRYVWGVGVAGGSAGREKGWLDHIVKADLAERSAQRWSEPGCYPGEPVFVAAPASNGAAPSEDEGVLLSVVLDGSRESSFLLVLDAKDLSELARAEVPRVIPFGFHGQFDRS